MIIVAGLFQPARVPSFVGGAAGEWAAVLDAEVRIVMSRRSPFWQPFTARTPLGYSVAGYFSHRARPCLWNDSVHPCRWSAQAALYIAADSQPISNLALMPRRLMNSKEPGQTSVRALERPGRHDRGLLSTL